MLRSWIRVSQTQCEGAGEEILLASKRGMQRGGSCPVCLHSIGHGRENRSGLNHQLTRVISDGLNKHFKAVCLKEINVAVTSLLMICFPPNTLPLICLKELLNWIN